MSEFNKISFVIPCYRSEKTIRTVVDEIEDTMAFRPEFEFEIILVNDGSPDGTWQEICDLVFHRKRIIGINLAQNFGQHGALMAGYNQVSGDCIVSLDDDGQTPACEVFKLVDELEKGYDVVYASYPEMHQKWYRRVGSSFAKKMSDFVFGIKNDSRKGSSYFVMRRFVVEDMIKYTHSFPYVAGLVLRVTRNIGMVSVEQRERINGTSGYSFKSLVSLWLNGFTAFSVKPLELGAYVGFIFSALGLIIGLVTIIRKIVFPTLQAGWSSIFSALMIIGGAIMLMLGLIGEYIGRIYICINNSPQYVIREIVKNFEK